MILHKQTTPNKLSFVSLKVTRVFLLVFVVGILLGSQLSPNVKQANAASKYGMCTLTSHSGDVTKTCLDHAAPFLSAATAAADAKKCYQINVHQTQAPEYVDIAQKVCGSEAVGTCWITYSGTGGAFTEKKLCATENAKKYFAEAVFTAELNKSCYTIVLVQTTYLSARDCEGEDGGGSSSGSACDYLQEPGKPEVKCTIADKEDAGLAGKSCAPGSADTGCGLIEKYINPLIRLLAGLVGIIVVIMIIIGGIQYSSAGGDPSKVAAAKQRIYNAVFALVAFFLTLAFLQWLVPGGLL